VGLPADDQPATIRRGFVEELALPAEAFLDDADRLIATYPLRVARLETMPAVERAEGPEPGTVDATFSGRDFWVTPRFRESVLTAYGYKVTVRSTHVLYRRLACEFSSMGRTRSCEDGARSGSASGGT
jgi:hypothetical protein